MGSSSPIRPIGAPPTESELSVSSERPRICGKHPASQGSLSLSPPRSDCYDGLSPSLSSKKLSAAPPTESELSVFSVMPSRWGRHPASRGSTSLSPTKSCLSSEQLYLVHVELTRQKLRSMSCTGSQFASCDLIARSCASAILRAARARAGRKWRPSLVPRPFLGGKNGLGTRLMATLPRPMMGPANSCFSLQSLSVCSCSRGHCCYSSSFLSVGLLRCSLYSHLALAAIS